MESSNAHALESRRELKTRQKAWAQSFARTLASANISPNIISTFSVVFSIAALSAFAMAHSSQNSLILILAAAGIQLRLLCNMMDGMVAIEFKKKTATGDLYNEVPDRIADAIIILGAGLYCQSHDQGMSLAWANIFLATMTAYIRTLGASLGHGHRFLGPMAKQHRMALLTAVALIEAFVKCDAIYIGLWIMLAGLIVTVIRRLTDLAQFLKETK